MNYVVNVVKRKYLYHSELINSTSAHIVLVLENPLKYMSEFFFIFYVYPILLILLVLIRYAYQ